MEQFGQCAGVDKVVHGLSWSAPFDDQVCEGAGDIFETIPHFFDRWRRWVAPFGDFGADLSEVLVVEVVVVGLDDEGDAFVVVER